MIIQLIENIDIFDRVIFNRFIYLLTSLMHYFWTKEENFWEKGLFQGTSEWWEPRGRLNHIPRGIWEWQKLPGPHGTGSSVFPVASLIMTHLVLIKMTKTYSALVLFFCSWEYSLSISCKPSGMRPLSSSWHHFWYTRSSSLSLILAFSRSSKVSSRYWYLDRKRKRIKTWKKLFVCL